MNPDGEVTTGRDGIRDLARAFFEAHSGAKTTMGEERWKVLGEGSVVVDGTVTLESAEGVVLSRARVTVICVKDGSEWRIASLREDPLLTPDPLTPREHLESLSWLVGDWIEEGEDAYVRSSCRWSDEGPYLLQSFEVRDAAGETRRSSQRIAWDPLLSKVRSWTWDSLGGYGEMVWTPVGEGWRISARGVSSTGVLGTGTHRVTRKGENIIRWELTDWIVGDEPMEDRTHVIVRRPPEPR